MSAKKPYLNHLTNNNDLITSHVATRSGFLEMALERNMKANPIVKQAKILKAVALQTKKPQDLLSIDSIKDALITAAGFSDKAKQYILPDEKDIVISEFIDKFLIPAGSSYIEELVYRFLLTRGDSIGGSLRNLAGSLAIRKVSASIISAFTLFGISFFYQHKKNKKWIPSVDFEGDEDNIAGFSWNNKSQNRTLVFNYSIPSVGKNIDMCLINCSFENIKEVVSRSPEAFIALGEVKGGIDPAGADEHWKTARTAFNRIRQSFSNLERYPYTFFIGAAIEKNMSIEIWSQLESNVLSNAANLTDGDQLASITNWLCSI